MSHLQHSPSQMTLGEFMQIFGGVYEHSQWVAEAVWQKLHTSADVNCLDNVDALAHAMKTVVEASSREAKLRLLNAHPDLAGKAALAGELTQDSTAEQAGAGLDTCTEEELAYFQQLNQAYKQRFGFPFIMAVKGATKFQILDGFEERIQNSQEAEFAMALSQVHRIAQFRLADK